VSGVKEEGRKRGGRGTAVRFLLTLPPIFPQNGFTSFFFGEERKARNRGKKGAS